MTPYRRRVALWIGSRLIALAWKLDELTSVPGPSTCTTLSNDGWDAFCRAHGLRDEDL